MFMNYEEARAFIDRLAARGSRPGLEAVTVLLERLGNPQDELKFIHIAGTNGKGSVLAYLGTILEKAGYLTGKYTSPSLFSYREKIQINGEKISRKAFADLVNRIARIMEQMEQEGCSLPTVFEVETAAAFLYFREKHCDYVMLETGMGGRRDATNVIKTPVLTLLSSISMDHMEFLGNTLGEIAWNKAGIFKPGVPAASAAQDAQAKQVIEAEAREKGCLCRFVQPDEIRPVSCDLHGQCFSYKEFQNMKISLLGVHQLENAALALEGADLLRSRGLADLSDTAIREGLRDARWKGRFTILREKPLIILDGAHNPDAALRLRDTLERYCKNRKKYFIFGVFSDKEYDKIIEITAPLAEQIFAVETPDNPRALPARTLAAHLQKKGYPARCAGTIAQTVQECMNLAGEDDVILAYGSLSYLRYVEEAVRELPANH